MAGEQGPGPPVPPKKRRGLQRVLKGKHGGAPGLHRASVDPIRRAALLNDSQRNLNTQAAEAIPSESRTVLLDSSHSTPGFTHNGIKTAKYNPITFLPIFLFEMFSRAAYLYFLIQACLAWWSTVSPYGGFGSTAALVFVLLVAGIKAVYEDFKRHGEDKETNNSVTHVMQPDGSFKEVIWRKVEVGQIVKVEDEELFPADLLCLRSALPDSVCFIRTTNLDGETNLKVRSTLPLGPDAPQTDADWLSVRGRLQCEVPNADLHKFKGRFNMEPKEPGAPPARTLPVTMDAMLLRGCTLKNSGHILGLVVYTGAETRIQQNAAETPLKYGSFDNFLNIQIVLIIGLQIAMCLLHGGLDLWWRNKYGVRRYALALTVEGQGNYTNDASQFFINLVTFWILYSYLVPISLFVTMEIVKFWQGFVFVNNDPEMKDAQGNSAKARNTNLNEDLGKVAYVFSDKTGTLTSNEMQLRQIAIEGTSYGRADFRLEDHEELGSGVVALDAWDQRLGRAARGNGGGEGGGNSGGALSAQQHAFWTNVCICNSLIVERGPDGEYVYQGPSPDEVALVEGAARLGFKLTQRTSSYLTISFQGEEEVWEVLNILEYSSARARMSVIARGPDGNIHLFCKGADARVLSMVKGRTATGLYSATERNLHEFAVNGLRTLVVAGKQMGEDEWAAWDARYQKAAADLEHRDELVAKCGEEVECDLELTGVTAIEDKLQDGVPAAIQSLLEARIKVWVITGDKQETAINIAISCKLILNPDALLICNADTYEGARDRLHDLLQIVQSRRGSSDGKGRPELVIDGPTLSNVLEHDSEALLAEVGSHCASVVICRASPSQKAAVVTMMRNWELRQAGGKGRGLFAWWRRKRFALQGKMLAIGDGANDVAMIQSADIGVGIMGKEGRQAVNNSDYAIGQFRFLVRLLLVHGTLSNYRLARLIKYSFFKNIVFCAMLFFFQFFCAFSGQTLVDGVAAAVYNVIFTSIPILLYAVLDRPVHYFTTLMRYPQMYNKAHSMDTSTFWRYSVGTATLGGALVFFLPYFSISEGGRNSVADLYSVGKTVFICIVLMVNAEVALTARYWTRIFVVFVVLSYVVAYIFLLVYMWIDTAADWFDPAQYGTIYYVMADPTFWFVQIAVVCAMMGYRLVDRSLVWCNRPHDDMLLAEAEKQGGSATAGLQPGEAQRLKELGVLDVAHTGGVPAHSQNGGSSWPGFDGVSSPQPTATANGGSAGGVGLGHGQWAQQQHKQPAIQHVLAV